MNAALKLPSLELEVPDGFEMSDGRLVELKTSFESAWIGGQLVTAMNRYLMSHPLGLASQNATFRCFPRSRRTVRKPDMAFVRNGRWPDDLPPRTDAYLAPDLAVEIISPNDEAFELEQKIQDYWSVGIPLLWVIYPHTRTAYLYRVDRTLTFLTDGDYLDGESVLPGFRCLLGSVLPRLRPTEAPPEPAESPTP